MTAQVNRSVRLKTFAILVLVLGLVGATGFYWVESRSNNATLDELSAPGYLRARDRQIEVMMGPFGVTLTHWEDALEQPGTQAIIIAVVSALVAFGLFRAARRPPDDQDSSARARQP